MQRKKPLTLKRILKRHAKNPKDKEIHKIIQKGSIDEKEFKELLKKATKQEAFDKKR